MSIGFYIDILRLFFAGESSAGNQILETTLISESFFTEIESITHIVLLPQPRVPSIFFGEKTDVKYSSFVSRGIKGCQFFEY